jgi:response regulator RpfG family c-di-GMP phosphodiesterase
MSESSNNDEMAFAEESSDVSVTTDESWKIIIVDDEASIHDVTKLALNGCLFDGKRLEFVSAYSGKEAQAIIHEHPDAALMLLDVVMETDHAGLDVARYVRNDADNQSIRIVLRTGQPGQAPEREVITKYDINDYKEKTELTVQKLFTLMYASLRAYRDIIALENNKRGLEHVIVASKNLFELESMPDFAQAILEQITSLLHVENNAAYLKSDGLTACHQNNQLKIMAGTGAYADFVGRDAVDVLDKAALGEIESAIKQNANLYHDDKFTGYFKSRRGMENLVYMNGLKQLGELDRALLEVFARNISIAFENTELHQDVEETQQEIVYMLGDAVETRSKETGNHVKRVAEISKLLALHIGLDGTEAEIIKNAAPMHDIGKIGIPDAILNKPGKHTPEEFEIMKAHSLLGFDMLKSSQRDILSAGAVIARDHHEKWSGEGYPYQKSGEDIHVYGRIVAITDVFDALGSERCYKQPWKLEDIIAHIKQESGRHFEPRLVDGVLANIDSINAIRNRYPDPVA